jgi:chromosomal replication initiation ATPase DnaA
MLSRRKDRKKKGTGDSVSGDGAARPTEPILDGSVNPRARLGEMLVQEGVVTQGQLDEALTLQQEKGGFLGNTLVSLRYLDQSTLMSFLVKQAKIPHISLLDYGVDEELFKIVPKELCLKHLCMPIDQLGKILTVAMVNPFDADALECVRTTCPDLKIKPILCDYNHFDQVARKHLGGTETSGEAAEDVSAQSFGLRPTSTPKREEEAEPKKKRAAAKKPAASEGVGVDADVLAIQINAAVAAGLNDALAPLKNTVESMQQAMESLGDPVAGVSNVETFPKTSGKAKRPKQEDTNELASASGVVLQGGDAVRGALLESPQCSAFSFDDFFAGEANAVTESLVRKLALPDAGLAPMFLGGGVGLGKTHLLHAIGNAYVETNPDISVRCMTAGMFIRACEMDAPGGAALFLDTFSGADVLLLDDVHLFADRHDVQAAFVEVFDALCGAGRPVVVTGLDRGDGSRTLDAQLQSRLSGSIVATIKPPEFRTRIEILRHLSGNGEIEVPEEILVLIAERIKDDVRRLKGAFEKVSAYVRVIGDGVSVDDARDMIVQLDADAVA